MKILAKILGASMVTLGVLVVVGVASASTVEILQPASTQTFNEKVQINGDLEATGTISFPAGVHIGQQGTGGVTFFNGTIINDTTDSAGEGNPVTFGDDVRIDGYIYRGAINEETNNAVRIADSLEVAGSLSVAEMASAMGFTGTSFSGTLVEATYSLKMPVHSTLPSNDCRASTDVGKLITYTVNSNNTSLRSCQKVGGSYTWVAIASE